jgi:flavin reductase (DIM6/NTAB) family NADH-FMN oxidoreductase RutF
MELTDCSTSARPIVNLFRRLTLGVYVIGVAQNGVRDAFTAASVMHVSYRPLMLSLAINPLHAAYPLLTAGGTWTVNVLSTTQIELARRFGTGVLQGAHKMDGMSWGTGRLGAPFLISALAYFDCKLVSEFPAGDHRIVVGTVMNGKLLATQALPLRYEQTGDMDDSASFYPDTFEGAERP